MISSDSDFLDFIKPDCDRLSFLQNYLKSQNVESAIIPIKEEKHLYVKFPSSNYDPSFKIKTVVAHYDRVPGTKGANDNSFAVFLLCKWAVLLNTLSYSHNIRLIFTDGEEKSENGIKSQGAYGLAELFKRLKITKDDIFVFDCMGRGDVIVLSENDFSKKVNSTFIEKYKKLETRCEKLLQKTFCKWIKLKTPLSDNAGFLACSIPAVSFTMLPSTDIENLINYGTKPESWNLLHTVSDDESSLTNTSEEIFWKLLNELQIMKTLT